MLRIRNMNQNIPINISPKELNKILEEDSSETASVYYRERKSAPDLKTVDQIEAGDDFVTVGLSELALQQPAP